MRDNEFCDVTLARVDGQKFKAGTSMDRQGQVGTRRYRKGMSLFVPVCPCLVPDCPLAVPGIDWYNWE